MPGPFAGCFIACSGNLDLRKSKYRRKISLAHLVGDIPKSELFSTPRPRTQIKEQQITRNGPASPVVSAELRSAKQSLPKKENLQKMKKGGNFSGKGRSFSEKGRSFSGGVKRKTVMKRREQGSNKKGGFAEINSDQMLKLCPLSSPTQPRHFLSLLPLSLSPSLPMVPFHFLSTSK